MSKRKQDEAEIDPEVISLKRASAAAEAVRQENATRETNAATRGNDVEQSVAAALEAAAEAAKLAREATGVDKPSAQLTPVQGAARSAQTTVAERAMGPSFPNELREADLFASRVQLRVDAMREHLRQRMNHQRNIEESLLFKRLRDRQKAASSRWGPTTSGMRNEAGLERVDRSRDVGSRSDLVASFSKDECAVWRKYVQDLATADRNFSESFLGNRLETRMDSLEQARLDPAMNASRRRLEAMASFRLNFCPSSQGTSVGGETGVPGEAGMNLSVEGTSSQSPRATTSSNLDPYKAAFHSFKDIRRDSEAYFQRVQYMNMNMFKERKKQQLAEKRAGNLQGLLQPQHVIEPPFFRCLPGSSRRDAADEREMARERAMAKAREVETAAAARLSQLLDAQWRERWEKLSEELLFRLVDKNCSADCMRRQLIGDAVYAKSTPLNDDSWRSRAAKWPVVRLLLERGADITAEDSEGWSVLHHAAHCETAVSRTDPEGLITVLVAAGARVGARDPKGVAPLHVAASEGNVAAARALLACKASTKDKMWQGERYGKTPLDVATDKCVRELLQQHSNTADAHR